jgi:small-conductance mechanosensitive channel
MKLDSPMLAGALLATVILVVWTLLLVARRVLGARLLAAARLTHTTVDDLVVHLLERTGLFAVVFVVIWAAAPAMPLPGAWRSPLRVAAVLALTIQLAIWMNEAVRFLTRRFTDRSDVAATTATTVTALSFAVRLVLLTVLVLLALANLGVDVSTLLAGLGVGGIAVALALQSVLKDLFGALSIVVNKPFLVGDTIEVGNFIGEVRHVGMRSTRLRNLPGEEIIMPNQLLIDGVVRNHSRMRERRVSFVLTLHTETRPAELDAAAALMRDAVRAVPRARLARAQLKHAVPTGFEFEIVYFFESPDYDLFAAAHHGLLVAILKGLDERGIALAAPPLAGAELARR